MGRVAALVAEQGPEVSWQARASTEWPACVHCACAPRLGQRFPGPWVTRDSCGLADLAAKGSVPCLGVCARESSSRCLQLLDCSSRTPSERQDFWEHCALSVTAPSAVLPGPLSPRRLAVPPVAQASPPLGPPRRGARCWSISGAQAFRAAASPQMGLPRRRAAVWCLLEALGTLGLSLISNEPSQQLEAFITELSLSCRSAAHSENQ